MSLGRRAAAILIVACTVFALGCAAGGGGGNLPAGDSNTYARQLLRRECYGCHRLPHPEAWSDSSWQAALRRMKKRVALPPADWDSLAALGSRDSAHGIQTR